MRLKCREGVKGRSDTVWLHGAFAGAKPKPRLKTATASGYNGLRVVETALAIIESAREGRAVKIARVPV